MDTYYELVKEHTFETEFLPISMADAKTLISAYEYFRV